MQSTGMESSSKAFNAPMCASPRAPPPESTSPIEGRAPKVALCAASEVMGKATHKVAKTLKNPRVFRRMASLLS